MKFHIAASGKNQGFMVHCPAKQFCTLRTADGMPAHHGEFAYSKDANNWNVIRKTSLTSDKPALETSDLAMDTLEHSTSLPEDTVQAVVENEAANQLGKPLPNDSDELKEQIVKLAPKSVLVTFDWDKDRFKKMLPMSSDVRTDSDTLDAIADQAIKHDNLEIMRNVARNKSTSAKTLYKLSQNPRREVRLEVAKNLNANKFTLQDLSKSDDKEIVRAVTNNVYFRTKTGMNGQQDDRRISLKKQKAFEDGSLKLKPVKKTEERPVEEAKPERKPMEERPVTIRHIEPRKPVDHDDDPDSLESQIEDSKEYADSLEEQLKPTDDYNEPEIDHDVDVYDEEPADEEELDSDDYSSMIDDAEEHHGFFNRIRGWFGRRN